MTDQPTRRYSNGRAKAVMAPPPSESTARAEYSRVLRVLTDSDNDSYSLDRDLVARVDECAPGLRVALRSGHLFGGRAIRAATADGVVRQLAVIGVEYPRSGDAGGPDPHMIAPAYLGVRTVYLDSDPVVLVHAQAHHRHRDVRILQGDPTDPHAVLDALTDAGFDGRPTAVRLSALLLERLDQAHQFTRELMSGLAVGSVLILTHVSADHDPAAVAAAAQGFADFGLTLTPRTRAQVAALIDGLDPVDPGLTYSHRWRIESRGWAENEYTRGWAPAPDAPGLLYAVCAEKRR